MVTQGYSINKLRLICLIQDITLEAKKNGATQRWVFRNKIYPVYFISERTFNTYLAVPAKALLKEKLSKKKKNEKL